jgi:nicotinamidase-related amidase
MTAVIVVDMQNDFASKGGMFDRAGIDISGIQEAVDPTAKVLAAARKLGIKIIYLKMGYKPELSDLGAPNSVNRVRHLRLGVGEKITAPDGNEAESYSVTPGTLTSFLNSNRNRAMMSSTRRGSAGSLRSI